jgi:hypothetical protein
MQSFQSSDSVSILPAGDYTLTVANTSGHTGNYSFRLLSLGSSDPSYVTPLTMNTLVSGTVNPGNSTVFYSLNGTAGDHVYLDRITQGGGFAVNLWDVFGKFI